MSEPNFSDLLSSVHEDEASKRRYAQNSLIVDVAVALNKGLAAVGVSQRALAERLGKTEGFISQVLSGGSNITLRTLGDFAYGMNCDVDVVLRPQSVAVSEWTYNTEAAVITPTGVLIKACLDEGREQAQAANADYALAA